MNVLFISTKNIEDKSCSCGAVRIPVHLEAPLWLWSHLTTLRLNTPQCTSTTYLPPTTSWWYSWCRSWCFNWQKKKDNHVLFSRFPDFKPHHKECLQQPFFSCLVCDMSVQWRPLGLFLHLDIWESSQGPSLHLRLTLGGSQTGRCTLTFIQQ